MTAREKCRRIVTAGGTAAEAARRCGIKPDTVRKWAKRGMWKKGQNVPSPVPPKPPKAEWMQCYLHDNAHLVKKNGEAVCSTSAKPVSGIIGRNWHPWDGVTKCTRCMGWESKMNKD